MAAIDTPEETLKRLLDEVAKVVVGQRPLIEGLLVALLCRGHVLVEGVPGLAKTTAVRTLASALGLGFGRVQFTPDLLPGDLTGNPVFVPDRREFEVRPGPIFTPVLLADEINRAPAKVQSALLEAMEEGQVSIGKETLPLPEPFFVMATQNPVELAGTYPLPEAQVDRFLLKLVVPYPSEEEELAIVERDSAARAEVVGVTSIADVLALREVVNEIHVAPEVADYAVRIVRATREPEQLAERLKTARKEQPAFRSGVRPMASGSNPAELLGSAPVSLGASPRASIYLVRACRARALLDGRRFVIPNDVKRMAPDVLRHRVLVTYEAEADGVTPEAVVDAVLSSVETP
jgi:MoxR-like ATPase